MTDRNINEQDDLTGGLGRDRQPQQEESKKNKPLSYDDAKTKKDEASKNDWQEDFDVSLRGNRKDTYRNLKMIFKNDEKVKQLLKFDSFAHEIHFKKQIPWKSNSNDFSDYDITAYKMYIEENYHIRLGSDRALEVVMREALDYSYHPIKEKIEVAKWDGVQRAETLFIDFLGADNTEYVRAITQITLTGAIARIYQPGVKFDTTLVILGSQGDLKSWLIQKLSMNNYSDSLKSLSTKDDMQHLLGTWFVELAELEALKKTGIEEAKAFLTATQDKFRSPYGRMTETYLRQCIFIGTTNNHEFLKDKTGNRRFLPMKVNAKNNSTKSVDKEFTQEYIQQIWAEVLTWWLDDSKTEKEKLVLSDDMEKVAKSIQQNHTEDNPYQGLVDEYIEKPIPEEYYRLSLDERRMITFNTNTTAELNTFGYVKKEKISAQEIWQIVLNNDTVPKKSDLADIREAIRNSKHYQSDAKSNFRFGDGIGQVKTFNVKVE